MHLAVMQPGYFCCDDGLCIDSELRCDNNHHCDDHSDEEYCDIIQFPTYEYKVNMPPSQRMNKGTTLVFPKTNVEASVSVMDIFDIKEEESVVSLVFSLTLKWNDLHINYNFL